MWGKNYCEFGNVNIDKDFELDSDFELVSFYYRTIPPLTYIVKVCVY